MVVGGSRADLLVYDVEQWLAGGEAAEVLLEPVEVRIGRPEWASWYQGAFGASQTHSP
jgi:hypothetical protein